MQESASICENEKETSPSVQSKLLIGLHDLKMTMLHFVKVNQLLFMFFQFNIGLCGNFAIGEITRAYVSCVFGVKQVSVP